MHREQAGKIALFSSLWHSFITFLQVSNSHQQAFSINNNKL
jgi:hypothetical protein